MIRTVRPGELDSCTDLAGATGDRNVAARATLRGYLAQGTTRPEWCFVAEEDGRTVGHVVLWSTPGNDVPLDLILVEAGPDDTGRALLDHAAEYARAHGGTRLGHALDHPVASAHASVEERRALLESAGFSLARDGMRWRWTAGSPVPADTSGLRWASMPEVGREAFVDALEHVVVDTADSWIRLEIAEHGVRRAGEILLEGCEGMRHEPGWFEIGYAGDSPAAVSLPAANPNVSVLGFVGVTVGHRGRGYATAVVARGTGILAAAGVAEIRADCDRFNPAMVRAFRRAGYENFVSRLDYAKAL
ncbi:GNAT family N-acetyltransferase [Longispora sp. K20-0274]|uniref:GNAT family N-acetyltransferase n=1 Tax=Longispora sp. K20-0274 TaxID=3088255 RepID=UPI00399A8683